MPLDAGIWSALAKGSKKASVVTKGSKASLVAKSALAATGGGALLFIESTNSSRTVRFLLTKDHNDISVHTSDKKTYFIEGNSPDILAALREKLNMFESNKESEIYLSEEVFFEYQAQFGNLQENDRLYLMRENQNRYPIKKILIAGSYRFVIVINETLFLDIGSSTQLQTLLTWIKKPIHTQKEPKIFKLNDPNLQSIIRGNRNRLYVLESKGVGLSLIRTMRRELENLGIRYMILPKAPNIIKSINPSSHIELMRAFGSNQTPIVLHNVRENEKSLKLAITYLDFKPFSIDLSLPTPSYSQDLQERWIEFIPTSLQWFIVFLYAPFPLTGILFWRILTQDWKTPPYIKGKKLQSILCHAFRVIIFLLLLPIYTMWMITVIFFKVFVGVGWSKK